MPRTITGTQERFVDGVKESGHVWIDMLREGNDRMHRLNRLLLDEASRTQEESADLFGQFVAAPTNLGEFTNSLVGTLQERGRRRASLARRVVNDIGEAASDTRRLLTRATDAGRRTVAATAVAGSGVAGRIAEEISERAEDVSESTDRLADQLRREERRAAGGETARTRRPKRRTTRKASDGQS